MTTGTSFSNTVSRVTLPVESDQLYSLDSQSSLKNGSIDREGYASVSGTFRILDLPQEIRQMIFSYFYDSSKVVLRYYWEEPNLFRGSDLRLVPIKRRMLLNTPQMILNRVCRQFALDVSLFVNAKCANLTIDNEAHHKGCVSNFILKGRYSFLRSRLVTLKYVTGSNDEKIPWSELVRACPNLRNIDVIITTYNPVPTKDRGMCTSGKDYAQLIVQETMGRSVEQMHGLERMALPNLACILENDNRENYSVTGRYRRVGALLSGAGLKFPLKDMVCECVSLNIG